MARPLIGFLRYMELDEDESDDVAEPDMLSSLCIIEQAERAAAASIAAARIRDLRIHGAPLLDRFTGLANAPDHAPYVIM